MAKVKKLSEKQASAQLEAMGQAKAADLQTAIAPASDKTFWAKNWPIIRTLLVIGKSTIGIFKNKAWKAGIDLIIMNGDAVYGGTTGEV